jgi:endoglucanase
MPAHRPTPSRLSSKRRPTPLRELVRETVSIPTAAYLEGGVVHHLRRFAAERGLDCVLDEFGNVHIEYRRGRRSRRRPLVLGAHMDHPGFVVTAVKGRRLTLEFRGGLSAQYGKGEQLRIYAADCSADGGATTGVARITSVQGASRVRGGPRRLTGGKATLEPGATARAGDLALWDVPECRFRGEIVHARQCDDLIGAVSVLATLDRLAAAGSDGHVVGLFTRAEEVGLCGASAAARARLLPEDAVVIAVETSSKAAGRADQGGGPIIRVGDAVHIFSPRVTEWMTALAQQLARERGGFAYQRRLMDGGTTEATSYDLYGYETGAACVALGNYHNAGPRGRVAAETVHLGDLEGLVRLFERLAAEMPRFERSLPALKRRFDDLGREAAPRLRRTAKAFR